MIFIPDIGYAEEIVHKATNPVASKSVSLFDKSVKFTEKFMDVKTFLFKLSEQNNWSLIVSKDVKSYLKKVKGNTLREILHSYLSPMKLGWKFHDNCLYVAKKSILDDYFKHLPEYEMTIPDGDVNAKLNCSFADIDLTLLCKFLKNISKVDIASKSGIETNVMMRSIDMPWKHVLSALIYLNSFRAVKSEYSVFICPSDVPTE